MSSESEPLPTKEGEEPRIKKEGEISWEQLDEHRSAESAWTCIDGNVYDLTGFLKEHPGGQEVLLTEAVGAPPHTITRAHARTVPASR